VNVLSEKLEPVSVLSRSLTLLIHNGSPQDHCGSLDSWCSVHSHCMVFVKGSKFSAVTLRFEVCALLSVPLPARATLVILAECLAESVGLLEDPDIQEMLAKVLLTMEKRARKKPPTEQTDGGIAEDRFCNATANKFSSTHCPFPILVASCLKHLQKEGRHRPNEPRCSSCACEGNTSHSCCNCTPYLSTPKALLPTEFGKLANTTAFVKDGWVIERSACMRHTMVQYNESMARCNRVS
jgi:hypothetical protein